MKRVSKNIITFLKNYGFLSPSTNSIILIILTLCIVVGMTLGAIAVGNVNMEFLHKLDFLFLNDFKSRTESSWTEIFITSFASAFIFALILEFTALSFWGVAIIPLIILIKSFGIGISAGYLYFIYGLKGIAFYTLILLPGIFISLIGFIFISCSAIDISYKFLKNIFPKTDCKISFRKEFKSHLHRFCYAISILLISSFVDSGFMAAFSRFFEF